MSAFEHEMRAFFTSEPNQAWVRFQAIEEEISESLDTAENLPRTVSMPILFVSNP
jgi:hypothetical protein